MAKGKSKKRSEETIDQLINTKCLDRLYSQLDQYQKQLYESLFNYDVVFVDDPAGTGKTTVAVMAGVQALREGKKLIYIRFPSRRGEKLGFVPGDIDEKERKYMLPFYEALEKCGLSQENISLLKERGLIETRTDVTERGRNITNSFVIIDEAQNAEDIEQLRLILTRIHDDCTVAVIGHSGQSDNHVKRYGEQKLSAFQFYMYHMTKKNWAIRCRLARNYRGRISTWADNIDSSLSEI